MFIVKSSCNPLHARSMMFTDNKPSWRFDVPNPPSAASMLLAARGAENYRRLLASRLFLNGDSPNNYSISKIFDEIRGRPNGIITVLKLSLLNKLTRNYYEPKSYTNCQVLK
jgi:hypothetical protein